MFMTEKNTVGKIQVSSICVAEASHKRHLEMLNSVYDAMSRCYGPYGGLTLITNDGDARITKDGVTILTSLIPANEASMPLLSLLKKASARSDLKAGDGTTTTVLAIIDVYRQCVANNMDINPEIVTLVEEFINKNKKIVENYSELVDVARVALNHNEEYTKIFEDIYKHMESLGKDFKSFDITPRTVDNGSDKATSVRWSVQTGIKSMELPIITRGGVNYDRVKAISVVHPIDNSASSKGLGAFFTAWAKHPQCESTTLILLVPKINDAMKEFAITMAENVGKLHKKKITFDILEMINPINNSKADASYELGIGLCTPTIQLYNNTKTQEDGVTVEDMGLADMIVYFAESFEKMPVIQMSFNEFENSTTCIVVEAHEDRQKAKDSYIADMKAKLRFINDEGAISDVNLRLDILTGGAVTINISANTAEAVKFLTDTFQDACLHIKKAKTGVIAGANIGIMKALRCVRLDILERQPANTKEEIKNTRMVEGIETLHSAYMNMSKTLAKLKHKQFEKRGIVVDIDSIIADINDIVFRTEQAHLITPRPELNMEYGYDIIAESRTNQILSSATNEITLFKTAVEAVNMLMSINQVTFEDKTVMFDYTSENVEYK